MDSNVRDRIELLRFLMIFGVVVLHTPEYVAIADVGSDWFSLTKSFFQNSLFRTTVPVLTFISGYLVFHACLDQFPKALASKKARSLLIPFLIFNLPLLACVWLAESLAGVKTAYQLTPFDPAVWMDAAFGLLRSPVNYPLNFLRDMLVLMCMAPLMGMLIRKAPFAGFALVSLFFLNNMDGPLVLRDTMPVLFYAGGVVACKKWNLRALDAYALPCLVLFLLLCCSIIYFRVANTTYLRLVAPLLIWPASALLAGSRFGTWCAGMNRYSFFLFLAHAPILFATWLLYKRFAQDLAYPLYWLGAPLVTTAIIVAVFEVAMRLLPRAFPVMIGGRGKKKKPAPHGLAPAAPDKNGLRAAVSKSGIDDVGCSTVIVRTIGQPNRPPSRK